MLLFFPSLFAISSNYSAISLQWGHHGAYNLIKNYFFDVKTISGKLFPVNPKRGPVFSSVIGLDFTKIGKDPYWAYLIKF